MLGKRDKAAAWVAELRREIPGEAPETIVPLGAAIEVEGRLRLGSGRPGRLDPLPRGRALPREGHRPQVEDPQEPQPPDARRRDRPELGGEETLSGPKVRLADLARPARPPLLLGQLVRRLQGRSGRSSRAFARSTPRRVSSSSRRPGSTGPSKRTRTPLPPRRRPTSRRSSPKSYPGLDGRERSRRHRDDGPLRRLGDPDVRPRRPEGPRPLLRADPRQRGRAGAPDRGAALGIAGRPESARARSKLALCRRAPSRARSRSSRPACRGPRSRAADQLPRGSG